MAQARDILQVQEYLYAGLRSCALFDNLNIVLERKWRASSEVEMSSLWMTPRRLNADGTPATPVGAGAIIEMPRLELRQPNSLQRSLIVSIGIVEERNLNMTPGSDGAPGGTQMSAEEWAELLLDFMQGWVMNLSSALTPEVGTVKPAPDLVEGDGLVSYRAAMSLRRERRPMARCDVPMLVDGPIGRFLFTNGANSPNAAIYYFVAGTAEDLQLPCKDNAGDGDGHAVLFDGTPFAVASGQFINWAAWQDDRLPSHVNGRQIA